MSKKFLKKITTVFVAASLFVSTALSACGGKKDEDPFVWGIELPQNVSIGAEIFFRDYIELEDSAVYTLYVSVNGGEFVKQNTLVYVCKTAADYSFKIERNKGGDIDSIEWDVSVLPNAPTFNTAGVVSVTEIGEKRTFNAMLNVADLTVTPAELQDAIVFKSVDIQYLGVSTTETDPIMEESIALDASAKSYTFARAGIYTFHLESFLVIWNQAQMR